MDSSQDLMKRTLREVDPDGPRLWIHTEAAARHGLREGELAAIRSDYGEASVPVHVTERIRPDCVFLPHGFGHRSGMMPDAIREGARSSDLLGSARDHVTGNAAMHETMVRIEPVRIAAPAHAPPETVVGIREERGGAS